MASVGKYRKKGPVSSALTPATAWTTGPCRRCSTDASQGPAHSSTLRTLLEPGHLSGPPLWSPALGLTLSSQEPLSRPSWAGVPSRPGPPVRAAQTNGAGPVASPSRPTRPPQLIPASEGFQGKPLHRAGLRLEEVTPKTTQDGGGGCGQRRAGGVTMSQGPAQAVTSHRAGRAGEARELELRPAPGRPAGARRRDPAGEQTPRAPAQLRDPTRARPPPGLGCLRGRRAEPGTSGRGGVQVSPSAVPGAAGKRRGGLGVPAVAQRLTLKSCR